VLLYSVCLHSQSASLSWVGLGWVGSGWVKSFQFLSIRSRHFNSRLIQLLSAILLFLSILLFSHFGYTLINTRLLGLGWVEYYKRTIFFDDYTTYNCNGTCKLNTRGMKNWRFSTNISLSWQEHRTNDSILTELGQERELMGRVAKLKLQYFGHITRGSAGQLALTVLEWIMEGLRHQACRPTRQWIHDTEEWTGCEYIQLKEMSQDRAQWRRKISEWSSAVANHHRGRSTSEWVI